MNHTSAIINLASWFSPYGKVHYETKIGNIYTDLLLEYDNKFIAIEYQNSHRGRDYIIGKLTEYSRRNVYCSWIFNTKLLKTKQAKEAYNNYGFIYHYSPQINKLWKNEIELIAHNSTAQEEERVYQEVKTYPEKYQKEIKRGAKEFGMVVSPEDLTYEHLTYEYSELLDWVINEIITKQSNINIAFKTKPYLDIGLKLAYF